MKTVVITGSTRGIGFGLAQAFLERGCAVAINGRSAESVQAALEKLAEQFPGGHVTAFPGDAGQFEDLDALWAHAVSQFGQVDIWINNAGLSHAVQPFWQLHPEHVYTIIQTNLTGAFYGTQIAAARMLEQGFGAIYNMEGLGSTGRQVPGLSLYGLTKAGLNYFDRAAAVELEGKPVLLGSISPGMVLTDMLLVERDQSGESWERSKRIFNILADRVETVTPWLADQILANKKNGARIRWLTSQKIFLRFLSAPFTRRDLFTD